MKKSFKLVKKKKMQQKVEKMKKWNIMKIFKKSEKKWKKKWQTCEKK